ncbi:MAG: transcriptional repressor [Lachnospiraceae bacterium]
MEAKYVSEKGRKAEAVIRELKDRGYRITAQRKMLIQMILENEYSSCKEIYFAAKEKDHRVGIATVYRMVQLLMDMEIIHKEMVVRL